MKLGVNIDHVATLRQTRGTVYPDPLDAAIEEMPEDMGHDENAWRMNRRAVFAIY